MEKTCILFKRKQARKLFKKGVSKKNIAQRLGACRSNVIKWINLDEEEVYIDKRGWKKGLPRKYDLTDKKQIIKIRRKLEKDNSFFQGIKIVKANFEEKHKKKVSKSFVYRTLKEKNLLKSHKKKKKGVSKYMNYPKYTLSKLGKIMMSIDFVGPKYLKGSPDKINFLSCKYIRPEKEGIVKRIEGQTTNETIRILKEVWKDQPIPHVLKIDNDSAFGATLVHEKCIGRLTLFLLNLGVSPLYIAPRSPWNNGSVEGFNSVFSKKFWSKLQFTDEDEIDIKIKDFNIAYKKYNNLINNNPKLDDLDIKHIDDFKNVNLENKKVSEFKAKKVYFLRKVERVGEKDNKEEYGSITVLKQEIKLKKDLINLFVFCELNMKGEKIHIKHELKDGSLINIKSVNFVVKNIEY